MKKKLNIDDVARAAGVSTTTVSRVMNRVPTVSTENRAKVDAAIRQLKFRPNVAARRLAAGVSQTTFGLVIPQFEGVYQSFYILEVIKGIGRAAEHQNVDLLLHLAGHGNNTGSSVNLSTVEGLLFVDLLGQEDFLDHVLEQGVPCVVLNHYLDDLPVSCVAIDNAMGAKQAVDYLVTLGHRELATITGDLETQAGLDRLDGFIRACESHDITVPKSHIMYGDYSPQSARKAATTLLGLKDRPTAVCVASDEMALAVTDVARLQKLRVPEDLSIVGFDNNPLGAHGTVPLTTIHQPLAEMGEKAFMLLVQTRDAKRTKPLKMRLPTRLVERQSCRPARLQH